MEEYEYKFQDRNAILPWIDSCDIIWTCIEAIEKYVANGKLQGSKMYALKLSCVVADNDGGGAVHVYENLILHPTCDWKIDTFLKSGNYQIKICHGIPPVSELIGLKGWCRLNKEQRFERDNRTPIEGQFRNRVGTFYTNKAKLPRDTSVIPEPEESNPFLQDEKGDEIPF
jgi:hypothetical protein